MIKIKKILFALFATLIALTPLVLAQETTTTTIAFQAPVTGNVEIQGTCGITASSPLNFGITAVGVVAPDDSKDSTVSSLVSNTGSVPAVITILGADWLLPGSVESSPVKFDVSYTHWSLTAPTNYAGGTSLTTSDQSVDASLGNGDSDNVYFRVMPPLGVNAGSYSQTITFTSTC